MIVGGTAGIGFSTAHLIAKRGESRVVLCGRSPERGLAARAALVAEFPQISVHYIQGDAAVAHDSERMVQEAASRMGGLDALVNCAGGGVLPKLLSQIATAQVMEVLSSVASCVLLPARAAYEYMRKQGHGSIVCLASDAGKIATPGESVIGAGMAAIAMFCRGMAIEAKRDGVRVNCVTPSIVRGTPLYARLQADPFSHKLFAKAEELALLGVASAEDVAELIAFLIGPGARKMTGQTISVNGGISAA
jgi:NAD(P)-dependent dehydrogenase (short-subunit alcohol dehydrogenase family)